jgi:poly-gamma-glutamate synthesis protein (capsule biosynthesis protein)
VRGRPPGVVTLLVTFLVALADGGALTSAAEPAPRGCLTFVGDVSLARGVGRELARRGTSPWASFAGAPGFTPAWVGNFESAVLPPGAPPCPRADGLCLGVAAPALEWLRASPFRALSIANNHVDDFGASGREATRAALAARGIVPVAEEDGPTMLDEGGAAWALVSLDLAGRTADVRARALERARLQIGLGRARTGRVVVMPHWGREGQSFPAPEQERWASIFVAWGATLVVGSHAHVVQPARCDPGAAIFFGLGNHLFDEAGAAARDGLAVTCCPAGEDLRCAASHTERPPTSVYPAPAPPAPGADEAACTIRVGAPDLEWLAHPARAPLLYVQPFPAAGPHAFFSLRRHWSSFDREDALRPYVFRVVPGAGGARPRVVDVWRGTALARPLVAARLVDWRGTQILCALHRGDSFLDPEPETTKRLWAAYRWKGFGFVGLDDEAATSACEDL